MTTFLKKNYVFDLMIFSLLGSICIRVVLVWPFIWCHICTQFLLINICLFMYLIIKCFTLVFSVCFYMYIFLFLLDRFNFTLGEIQYLFYVPIKVWFLWYLSLHRIIIFIQWVILIFVCKWEPVCWSILPLYFKLPPQYFFFL